MDQVRQYIEQLIARYESARAENASLREELRLCQESGAALKGKMNELETEIETRKLAQAFGTGADPAQARAKVDRLIKEIDKCISFLEEA